jgi:hypothetical protein
LRITLAPTPRRGAHWVAAVAAMMGAEELKSSKEGAHVGTLVTLDLADDSPVLSLPWIITFGPMDEADEWEPVVCGPYERDHALALAETVIADEELMAVVEPVQPHSSVDEIREDIATAKLAAEADEDDDDYELGSDDLDAEDHVDVALDGEDFDDDFDDDEDEDEDELELEEVEPTAPPSPAEVRAGFARIAARLASTSS